MFDSHACFASIILFFYKIHFNALSFEDVALDGNENYKTNKTFYDQSFITTKMT